MEDIKVGEYGLENETEGMYARTDNGIIGEILNSNSDEMINGPEILVNGKIYCIERNSIKEVKDNLIDLIEVGDYVNGHKVVNEIYGEDDNNLYFEIEGGFNKAKYIAEKDIKSILTHELYEANAYKVKEKENGND